VTGVDECIVLTAIFQILTHGLELADELLLRPLGPLLLVRVDGAQDRTAWFTTILNGWNIQIVDEHDIRVLWGRQKKREQDGGRLEEMTLLADSLSSARLLEAPRRVAARRCCEGFYVDMPAGW